MAELAPPTDAAENPRHLTQRLRSLLVFAASLMLTGPVWPSPETPCTQAWYEWVDTVVPSGDGQGHGPDIGSREWMSVIEFRLGVRDRPAFHEPGTNAWCQYVDDQLAPSASPHTAVHPETDKEPVP